MSMEVIPGGKPYFFRSDIDQLKEDLDRILTSGMLTLGQYTRDFEAKFANLIGTRYAIAVNSGTAALEIALRAQGLRTGDEVIVPTNTFAATCAAVIRAGVRPVITDISPASMEIDSNILKKAITPKAKGVVAVHIGGLICPDIEIIREICDERNMFLIEDAAHAHGSKFGSKFAGSLGSAGCFSFYPTKVMTSGEGGMITTADEEVAAAAVILRDQGKESFNSNRVVQLGYNWRMPEICAAIGLTQLRRLPEFIENRTAIARMYDSGIEGVERVLTPANQMNNYYKYTFFLPRNVVREEFKRLCKERGVHYSGEVYWPPLHLQPAFRAYANELDGYEACEEWGKRMVNPPMFNQMTREQAQTVVQVTTQTLSELTR